MQKSICEHYRKIGELCIEKSVSQKYAKRNDNSGKIVPFELAIQLFALDSIHATVFGRILEAFHPRVVIIN